LPIALAFDMKLSKVLPEAGALMEPTMPPPQWRGVLQKNQIGVDASVTFKVNCLLLVRPESKPVPFPVNGVQGSLKVDCVTEWGVDPLGKKKVIKVPAVALMLAGLKTNCPPGATSTLICP